jgi:hypothetical protein
VESIKQRCTGMLDRLKQNPSHRRLAMARLMAMAFVIFAFLSFNSAHAKPTNSAHVKHTKLTHAKYKNSAHVKHTKNGHNLTINSNNLIKNGDNLIYDSDLDITWYYNPSLGAVNWNNAMVWAANLEIGGAIDWRLPTALNADGSTPTSGFNQIGSELGHLFYTSLGNIANSSLINTGSFTNLQPFNYWTSTEWSSYAGNAWAFSFNTGLLGYANKNPNSDYIIYYSAIAVHSGNVGATQIPEPGILLLLGPGLASIAVMRKKILQSLSHNEKNKFEIINPKF